jgi:hypothetical protein
MPWITGMNLNWTVDDFVSWKSASEPLAPDLVAVLGHAPGLVVAAPGPDPGPGAAPSLIPRTGLGLRKGPSPRTGLSPRTGPGPSLVARAAVVPQARILR